MPEINKHETKVTMSLLDYETLDAYKKAFLDFKQRLRSCVYINQCTTDSIQVAVEKQKLLDLVVPMSADGVELDGYPEGVNIVWKE